MDCCQKLAARLEESDAILIGTACDAPLSYGIDLFSPDSLKGPFHKFKEKYGFASLSDGLDYPFESPQQLWGFWSRLIAGTAKKDLAVSFFNHLKALIQDRPYFFITVNGDGAIASAGFPKERIFEVEGNWTALTCSNYCRETFYAGNTKILAMAKKEKEGIVPQSLIPSCPHCGAPLIPSMAAHVSCEKNWLESFEFVQEAQGKKLFILELGSFPEESILRPTFIKFCKENLQAYYAAIGPRSGYLPQDLAERSLVIPGDVGHVIQEVWKRGRPKDAAVTLR